MASRNGLPRMLSPFLSQHERDHIIYIIGKDRLAHKMRRTQLLQSHRFLDILGGCIDDHRSGRQPRLLFYFEQAFFSAETGHAQVEENIIGYWVGVVPEIEQSLLAVGSGYAGYGVIHFLCGIEKKLPVICVVVCQKNGHIGVFLDEKQPLSFQRKDNTNKCARVLFGFSADLAVMVSDDALAQGQTDAGAFEILSGIQPLEDLEDLFGIALIEPDTVVLYTYFQVRTLSG